MCSSLERVAKARQVGRLEGGSLLSRMLEGCSLLSRTALRAAMPSVPLNVRCPGRATMTEARRQRQRAKGATHDKGDKPAIDTGARSRVPERYR